MTSTIMTEDELQKQVASYLKVALPDGSIFHHSPNEGTRHVAFKMKLKSFGTQSGWPDLEIFCPGTATIFIELKRAKPKGKLSFNQALLRDQFENLGLHWSMCCTLNEVVDFLSPIVRLKGGTRFINQAKNGNTGRRVR